MKQSFSVKSIVRNSVLGVIALLTFAWLSAPNAVYALGLCSDIVIAPTLSIAIPGYGTFRNNRTSTDFDAEYTIAVPSGTILTATYHNPGAASYSIRNLTDRYPNGHENYLEYGDGSTNRTYTTNAITAPTFLSIFAEANCDENPSPGLSGSVYVNVTIATPAPTATLTASPNPVNSGSPTTLTWTSTNATSCTATGGAGFSTGNATGGNDASTNLTAQTTFSMSCTGAGGTVTKSVTVDVNAAPVNGDCGSAENGTYATAPTTNLCDAGTASAVGGGVTSWTWSCVGANGGTTASCDAAVTATPPLTCSGEVAGQTGLSYTFTGGGATSYTWSISPTSGTPSPTSGSGASVTKAFSSAGTKTITFTSGAQSAACTIVISGTPPVLGVALRANGSQNPITIAYGEFPLLSWASAGATRCDSTGAVPSDTDWAASNNIGLSGTRTVSPLVRTTYSIRCVNAVPQTDTDSILVHVQPQCLPAGQSVDIGETATLTAAGGNGTYAWTATGGSTTSGNASSFSTSYATAGTKTVSLVSDGLTTNCTVTVATPASTGTIIVNSVNAQGEPFLTTWSLSGPAGGSQTQSTPSASATYATSPIGMYTLSADAVAGYTVAITPGNSQDLTVGITRTFTITYTDIPVGDPWVDISASPTSVVSGGSSMLSWTSDGIEPGTCVASDDWSGAKVDEGSESTGALTAGETYTITCDKPLVGKGAPETVSDIVNVSVVTISGDDDDGTPDCSDGANNDAGDNLIDYPADPGCYGDEDPSEEDIQPGDDDDVVISSCDDGFDNDGDGTIDANDSGCDSGDGTEQSEPDIREI